MGALLDAMGAVVAGSLVMITMILSILNFQQFNYNIKNMIYLTDLGENTIKTLDQYYLSNIEEINYVSPRMLKFKAKLDNVNTDSVIVEIGQTKDGIGYPLTVTVVNLTSKVSRIDAGPFTVADTVAFTYYNKDLDTTSVLADIRNMRMDLSFPNMAWTDKESTKSQFYPITFWKSFKSIYLKSL